MALQSAIEAIKVELLDLSKVVGPLLPEFGRWMAFLIPVWLTGHFGFSFIWVLLGFAAYVLRRRDRRLHQHQDEMHRKAALCDVKTLVDVVPNPPSWIYFPKRERVDWLNKIIQQIWPYIDDYVQAFINDEITKKTVQETIKAYNIDSFDFDTCTVGDRAPRVVNVHMLKSDETPDGRAQDIVFDMELSYSGDAQIKVSLAYSAVPKLKVGLKNLCFGGKLRVELQNFVGQIPICGSVCCYFLNKPELDFDLTNVGNMMDFAPLKKKINNVIRDSIAAMMVLPNRYPIPLMANVDTNLLKHPLPKGVVRIHVVNAKNLISNNYLGKYDPYVSLHIGDQYKTTARLSNEPNPEWNQVFEFVIWSSQQMIKLKLLDGDDLDLFKTGQDDPLGEYEVSVKSVKEQGYLPETIQLPNLKEHGAILNVRMLWSIFKTEPNIEVGAPRYEDQRTIRRLTSRSLSDNLDYEYDDPLLEQASKSFILVHLYGADGLQLPAPTKNVKAIVTIVGTNMESLMQESSTQLASADPKWEEAFQFLVNQYPDRLYLSVEVVDSDQKDEKKRQLGHWSFPLIGVMTKRDWTLERQWHESGGRASSSAKAVAPQRLSIRICVRLLSVEKRVCTEESQEKSGMATPTNADFQASQASETPILPQNVGEDGAVKAGGKRPIAAGAEAGASNGTDWNSFPHVNVESIYGERIQGQGDETDEGFGRIRLTLEPKADNVLRVVVHECNGLIAADDEGNTDAFVKLSLDRLSGSKKTRVVEDSLNPEFEETFVYELKRELLELQRLTISVKNDKSIFSREPSTVGRRVLELGEYRLNQSVTRWFALKDPEADTE